jgi:putative DNA primase/helicase
MTLDPDPSTMLADQPDPYQAAEEAPLEGGTPDEDHLIAAPTAPMKVARDLLASSVRDGAKTLRHYRGAWWRWNGRVWEEAEGRAIKSWLYAELDQRCYLKHTKDGPEPTPWAPTKRKVADVEEAAAALSHLGEAHDAPCWLGRPGPYPARELVACRNGLLHLGSRALLEHTPRFFSAVSVPFDYAPDAPAPRAWHRFLDQLWDDGDDGRASKMALQEWFGYCLTARTDLQKMLMLVGPTRSGKGTLARILTQLVGSRNVAGPTLDSLSSNFGLAPLLGKPLAIIADARLGGGSANAVVERLLSISGEDWLTVDRKYREQWSGKLPTRVMLLSNELPRFGDASGAIAGRFVILSMSRSFLGREDPSLTGTLAAELPGILNWALEGLDRLDARGRFTVPPSSDEAVLALRDLVSPVAAFVRDRCDTSDLLAEAPVPDVYEAWKQWAEDNGHRAKSVHIFGRDLRSVVPHLRTARPAIGGERIRVFRGLRLEDKGHNAHHCGPLRTHSHNTSSASGNGHRESGQRRAATTSDDPARSAAPRTGTSTKTQVSDPVRNGPQSSALWPLHSDPISCRVCGEPLQHPDSLACGICRKTDPAHDAARKEPAA